MVVPSACVDMPINVKNAAEQDIRQLNVMPDQFNLAIYTTNGVLVATTTKKKNK